MRVALLAVLLFLLGTVGFAFDLLDDDHSFQDPVAPPSAEDGHEGHPHPPEHHEGGAQPQDVTHHQPHPEEHHEPIHPLGPIHDGHHEDHAHHGPPHEGHHDDHAHHGPQDDHPVEHHDDHHDDHHGDHPPGPHFDESHLDDPFLGNDDHRGDARDGRRHERRMKMKERLLRRLRRERRRHMINPNPLREFLRDSRVEISPDILPPELRTPLTELTPLATCGKPASVRIHRENFNSDKKFDRETLKAIIGRPSKYADNEVDANHQSFSCIDSRHQGPVLGTPGGDFGEFLVALSVMEDLIRYNFTQNDVQQLITQWVTWDKRGDITFFHNTDEEAIRNLARRLHVRGVANVLTDVNIYNPPHELREEMLLFLNQTQFQGSQIIRNLLDYPRKYQIRSELTSSMIRAFYTILWDKQAVMEDDTPLFTKMHLEVYPEQAKPLAWVSVRSGANCEIAGSSHMVSPLNAIPKPYLTGAYKTMKIPADWEQNVPAPVVTDEVAKALGIDTTIYDALGLPDTHESMFLELDVDEAPSVEMEPAQVFVHHPHAVRQLRKWLSRFFALRFPLAASQPKILQLIERKQQSILEGLAESVGRDVPFFTVTIE